MCVLWRAIISISQGFSISPLTTDGNWLSFRAIRFRDYSVGPPSKTVVQCVPPEESHPALASTWPFAAVFFVSLTGERGVDRTAAGGRGQDVCPQGSSRTDKSPVAPSVTPRRSRRVHHGKRLRSGRPWCSPSTPMGFPNVEDRGRRRFFHTVSCNQPAVG